MAGHRLNFIYNVAHKTTVYSLMGVSAVLFTATCHRLYALFGHRD